MSSLPAEQRLLGPCFAPERREARAEFQLITKVFFALALAAAPAEASSAPPLQFFEVLEQALEENPALRAYEREAQALLDRADASAAFPDPVVGFSIHDLPVPSFSFREDMMTMSEAMVSQRLPWFGKRDLRRRSEGKGAEVVAAHQAQYSLALSESVAEAYAKLWLAHHSRALLAEQKKTLGRLAALTRQGLSVGAGRQADFLLAEAEAASLSQSLLRIEEEEASARARLAALISAEAPLAGTPEELPPLPLPDLDHLLASIERHPELQSLRHRQEALHLEAELARKEKMPDPEISLSYGVRAEHPDMVGIGLSFPIPIFGASRADRLAAAAHAEAEAIERRMRGRWDALAAELRAAHARARAELERERLYTEEILPRIRQSAQASAAAYVAGGGSLLAVLDQQRKVFAREIERLEARASSFVALVRALARAGALPSIPAEGES